MAKTKNPTSPPGRPDAYLGLLFLALLALIGAAVALYLEYATYPESGPGKIETTAPVAANPPTEKVDGTVTDASDSQVTFRIDRGAGLAKDHTLELFSVKEKVAYLGMVKVTGVAGNTATATPLGKMNGTPKVDDLVSSRLGP